MQTIKPRARPYRMRIVDGVELPRMWRISFPGSNIGFVSHSIERALTIAFTSRLAQQLNPCYSPNRSNRY